MRDGEARLHFPAATERRLEVERIRKLERVAEAARKVRRGIPLGIFALRDPLAEVELDEALADLDAA